MNTSSVALYLAAVLSYVRWAIAAAFAWASTARHTANAAETPDHFVARVSLLQSNGVGRSSDSFEVGEIDDSEDALAGNQEDDQSTTARASIEDPATAPETSDDVLQYIESYMAWLNTRRASIKPLPSAPNDEFLAWLSQNEKAETASLSNQEEHLSDVPLEPKKAPTSSYRVFRRLYIRSKY
ncbi:hypothetical protein SPRG_00604 [Saprolegnia parasitica CBS 223.65]|uniref:Uncharacterized protein n=1 Tax=Saprolegnia parasitica (strain CBS 223.65) TaxID=695850 RepID=A0A067D785_SAPPC|nr:hypothetical protein SPRG_00604 [Saprolegnia parasitica CBS 223.65]KDO34541.1 hypothetical protein SPRG_00604 [Saprolegnia parasitica CBS 223.65]|eukprot:XP_012194219.1 hypothetical protein SPRG_00604 [Saprolegnia parasitica CBS 223.65]